MRIGTKSLLFGVHQFLWHPITVAFAWRKIYRRWPVREEWIAVFLHDIGYWGCKNIDGFEGRLHPERGARWTSRISRWFGWDGDWGCAVSLFHSREYARRYMGGFASDLCWPDKLSIIFEPRWFYLLRATLSGEIVEFRNNAIKDGHIFPTSTYREWFDDYKSRVLNNKEIVVRLKKYETNPLPVVRPVRGGCAHNCKP